MRTLHWENLGVYDDVNPHIMLMCCFYTHKNGQRMKNLLLTEKEDMDLMQKTEGERVLKRAEPNGDWNLKSYGIAQARLDMNNIMFGKF